MSRLVIKPEMLDRWFNDPFFRRECVRPMSPILAYVYCGNVLLASVRDGMMFRWRCKGNDLLLMGVESVDY